MSSQPSSQHVEKSSGSIESGSESDGESDSSGESSETDPGRRRVRHAKSPRRRLSQILFELVNDPSRDRISIADLVQIMDARAIGALLLIFALPNVLPALPGTSGVLGLPLLYLSTQMMLGKLPWLPPFISGRSMRREDFAALITRVTPILTRAEKLLVPRLAALSTPVAERLIGGLCLILAIVLVLPIPLGNMLPAFAVCLIALGVLERDGVWIIAGTIAAFASLLIVYGVVYAMIKTAIFLVINAF